MLSMEVSMEGMAVDAVEDTGVTGDTMGEDMVCTPTRLHPMQVIRMLQMHGPEPNLSTAANKSQMAKSPTNLKEPH